MMVLAVLLALVATLDPSHGLVNDRPSSPSRLNYQVQDTPNHHRMDSSLEYESPRDSDATGLPSSRRSLLNGLAQVAMASVALSQPKAAMAVDFQVPGMSKGPNNKRVGGLANKIKNSCSIMDELQRDLMQERWDRVEAYPAQLRSYVPVFTAYTDSAFPSDAPTDKGLRVALRYEVGRFFASVERFKQATNRRALDEAYVAFADMSLHLDRYLRVGGLYTYYDDTITLEPYYKGISESALVYADPVKDPPEVRDLVILVKGPEKGRTGIVIGIYRDGSNRTAVKLDRYKGMREIRVVPSLWVAKRLGEQDPDDVFLIKS
ncbi:expressed unknown protein [Seminavis robusta]|uniref:KOW domain-containing protein n=1 Tax=Seminavis robusta TaxID=568900 RepID=A0A9N8EHX2_9STRA|nr:expressed unknown protein [Seminavis robusta]|eukprot:Sro1192_g251110.1 n/a (320) ;mRNA; r:26091-27143